VLDVRVYRAAFLPALVALFVAAFSLADRPAPAVTPLTATAFDGARAFGGRAAPENSLIELGRSFPDRRPGSPDDRALADRVAATLGAEDQTGRPGFRVTRERAGDVETVIGARPGLSSRRIVVLAHRDARHRPGLAELSGTAAMLELARLFRGRDLRKTLVLVSTSGATEGFTGTRAWAEQSAAGPIDAVLVLGDMAGARATRPWVVPWSEGGEAPSLALQRTAEHALRAEARSGTGSSRAVGQWLRRALPATVSGQGAVRHAGLPAVMIGVSGERGPRDGEPVRRGRLDTFGRAALRTVLAIDAAGPADVERAAAAPPFSRGPDGVVTMRNVLPDWAVRLLVGTLLLPAFLTALDGFFRVRRRGLSTGPWLGWVAATGLPVLMAWLWARLLGLTGALDPPAAPVLPVPPLEAAGAVALGSVALVLALGWFGVRPLLLTRLAPRGSPAAGSLAAATGAVLCSVAALVWLVNPYAAALLLPAAHLWLFAAAPQTRLTGWAGVLALLAGLAPLALLPLYYAQAFAIGPLELVWATLLGSASGALSPAVAIVAGALAGCLAGVVLVMRTRRRAKAHVPPEPIRTRGPVTYAGPGSLGGTESALRR
jgi:Peptidase family M28